MHHAITNIGDSAGCELAPEVARKTLIGICYFSCLNFWISTLPSDVIGISFTTRSSVGAQNDGN